jgi:hypothetical protein
LRRPSGVILQPIDPAQTHSLRRPVWDLELGCLPCLGIRCPHQASRLHVSGLLLPALHRRGRCGKQKSLPSHPSSPKHWPVLFSPLRRLTDFQKHGDRRTVPMTKLAGSPGQFLGTRGGGSTGSIGSTAPPQRAPSFYFPSSPPLGISLSEAVQNKILSRVVISTHTNAFICATPFTP